MSENCLISLKGLKKKRCQSIGLKSDISVDSIGKHLNCNQSNHLSPIIALNKLNLNYDHNSGQPAIGGQKSVSDVRKVMKSLSNSSPKRSKAKKKKRANKWPKSVTDVFDMNSVDVIDEHKCESNFSQFMANLNLMPVCDDTKVCKQTIDRMIDVKSKTSQSIGDIELMVTNKKLNERISKSAENNENCLRKCKKDLRPNPKRMDGNEIQLNEQMERDLHQKKEIRLKKRMMKFVTKIPFSSPLGCRLRLSLNRHRLTSNKMSTNRTNEEFCQTNQDFRSQGINKYNMFWNCSNIEKKSWKTDLRSHSTNCFHYCFNRRQRLEKSQRIKTGLNWKSRIKLLNCKTVKIVIKNSDQLFVDAFSQKS